MNHNAKARRRKRLAPRPRRPPLRLTPYAWAKLLALRDLGETEVGGFGVSRPDDLLLVEDVPLVRQACTAVTVKFDDDSVANYFDEQVDEGRTPDQFGRIWIHTHPGSSPHPSHQDEESFARCFGLADWSVMFILARGGQTYARLRYGTGLQAEFELPVQIDYSCSFPASDFASWEAEYDRLVFEEQEPVRKAVLGRPYAEPPPWADDFTRGLGDLWLQRLPDDVHQDLLREFCDA